MQRIQKPLLKGIAALNQCIDPNNISDQQQDSLALLCNANYELNCLRKEFFKPEMNPKYVHLCKPSVTVPKWLFGDNLSTQVKDIQEEQKTTGGVIRRQAGQRGRRYQPYNTAYNNAGWVSGHAGRGNHRQSRDTGRPFLGQGPQNRMRQMRRRYQNNQRRQNRPQKEKKEE